MLTRMGLILSLLGMSFWLGLSPGPAAAEGDGSWSLSQAIEYAQGHNPAIAVLESQAEEARQAKNEAFSSYLPQLILEGGYTRIDNIPSIDTPMGSFKMGDQNNYKIQASLNQVLFASGQVYYANQAVAAQTHATLLQAEAARLKVAKGVAEVYLGVLLAQNVFAAREESLNTARAHLDQVKRRFEAGTASRFEFLRSQVEVDNLVPTVSEAGNNVELAKTMLRQLMGLEPEAGLTLSDSLETGVARVNEAEFREKAQRGRPELRALSEAREGAFSLSRSRRGAMLPSVALFGTYGYQKPYYFKNEWEKNWTLGIGAKLTLFDGLKSYAGYRQARTKAQTFAHSLAQTRAEVNTEVTNALLQVQEASTREETTAQNLGRAGEVVKIAEESYRAGAVTSLEVIDAELAATNARIAHLKALYDYRLSRVRLFAAVGDRQEIGR